MGGERGALAALFFQPTSSTFNHQRFFLIEQGTAASSAIAMLLLEGVNHSIKVLQKLARWCRPSHRPGHLTSSERRTMWKLGESGGGGRTTPHQGATGGDPHAAP